MAEIERVGEHRLEDWAIKMMASSLYDELERGGYLSKNKMPFAMAIFNAIARHPDLFRRRGYSIDGMRFSQHKYKKGKLVGVVADFHGLTPTDKAIENEISN